MKKWRFLSNQNSTIIGINDAGIETFTANMNRSLVREIIQNSLDAVLPDINSPVFVEFVDYNIDRNKIPDVENLKEIIIKCKNSNKGEPDAFKFFDNAERLISQPTINILRVSDHNTIGLEGSDTCEKGTSWSRLIKESGSSNKGKGSGGSFGIGKSAAFACSDFRTVFYSSKDSRGLVSNIGVAKLVSYEDDSIGGWTTGTGYYSEDERFRAITELASLDPLYTRMDSGTDIYIVGMHRSDNFKKEFINAVLLDFLVSLIKRKLIVKIQDETLDDKTLPAYISKLNPNDSEEIRDLLIYYRILTSKDPRIKKISLDSNIYGKRYGFNDGECTLYLMEGEGFNRKIMITRRAGMRILEQNRISGSIEFTGVLVIEGDNMNEAFKKMEVPSHDAWEPGRCRGEEKRYTNILNDFKKYLRNTVKECYGNVESTSMDALGASDFLPDKYKEDDEEKLKKDELSTRIKKLDGKVVQPSETKTKAIDIIETEQDDKGNSSGGGKLPGPGPDSGTTPGPGPGPMPGSNPGDVSGPGEKTPGEKTTYQEIRVKKRLICTKANEGSYRLSMSVPSSVSKAKLVFSLSGEQSDFDLPINSATISSTTKCKIDGISGNTIFLSNLESGENLKIDVNVDFDRYCMMEVDYYANKK